MEIFDKDANTVWLKSLQFLLEKGTSVIIRGFNCFETINFHTIVPMELPIVVEKNRKLGYKFMRAEAAWILSGDNRVATISPYSKKISDFSDDGIYFFGAYGPKIVNQLEYIIKKLIEDLNTRQAVITIWRENPPNTKDVPCTISIQFLIRNNKLHCIDNMRSSDIWLGWPYDIFNFTMLSSIIILILYNKIGIKLQLGNIYMNLGSCHLYEENLYEAKNCLKDNCVSFDYNLLDPINEWSNPKELLNDLKLSSQGLTTNSWCNFLKK